jgi:hypothetical protein
MARLRKTETVKDIFYYEVELTSEQLTLFKENQDAFWEKYADEISEKWEQTGDEAGSPQNDYELVEE